LPLLPTLGGESYYVFRFSVGPTVRCYPSDNHQMDVNVCFTWHNISMLSQVSGGLLVKVGTNIHHMSGRCWNVFQDQRSKVNHSTSIRLLRHDKMQTNEKRMALKNKQNIWANLCVYTQQNQMHFCSRGVHFNSVAWRLAYSKLFSVTCLLFTDDTVTVS